VKRRPYSNHVRLIIQSLGETGLDSHVSNGVGSSLRIAWDDHHGRHHSLIVSTPRNAREAARASVRDLKRARLVGFTATEVSGG
jgi:hypothetical protein